VACRCHIASPHRISVCILYRLCVSLVQLTERAVGMTGTYAKMRVSDLRIVRVTK